MALSQRLYRSLAVPAVLVVLMWVVFLVEQLLNVELAVFGVYPRETFGLRGVLFMPLLHGSLGHILSNTLPFFALTAMVLFFYPRIAVPAFVMIYLLAGLATWIFARASFHIGASGVIYGLVAFLFWIGLFRRNVKAIALSLVVLFYYGGLFMGILPGQEGISWDGHLLGALAGVFTAYWFRNRIEYDEARQPASWETEPQQPAQSFLPPDTFSQTKYERAREEMNRNLRWPQ